MLCHACGKAISNDSVFCSYCGERVNTLCPNCGERLPNAARFCFMCGTKLEATTAEIKENVDSVPEVRTASEEARSGIFGSIFPKDLLSSVVPPKAVLAAKVVAPKPTAPPEPKLKRANARCDYSIVEGRLIFAYSNNITELEISVDWSKIKSCDSLAKYNALKSVTLSGTGMNEIPVNLFQNCRFLKKVDLLNTDLPILKTNQFEGTLLAELALPDSCRVFEKKSIPGSTIQRIVVNRVPKELNAASFGYNGVNLETKKLFVFSPTRIGNRSYSPYINRQVEFSLSDINRGSASVDGEVVRIC